MSKSPVNPHARELLEVQRTLGWMDLVIGSIDDGVYVTDRDGRLVFANQCFADIVSQPRIFLLGQKLDDIFPVALDDKVTDDMGYGSTPAEDNIGIYAWQRNDTKKMYKISKRMLLTTKQTVYLAQDISKQQELSNMKDSFINLASHQLRTPMTSIMLHAHLLSDMVPADNKEGDIVRKIITSSERMTRLINDILIITKLQNNSPELAQREVINFQEIIDGLCHEIEPSAKKSNISLKFSYPKPIKGFRSNKSAVHEILSNLLVNAVQYTPSSGSIKLEVTATTEYVTIRVQDTGIGIPEAMVPLIFDQFSRADNAFEAHNIGTGLGLYLVKLLLININGKIVCDSVIDRGTTFTISLPRTT